MLDIFRGDTDGDKLKKRINFLENFNELDLKGQQALLKIYD